MNVTSKVGSRDRRHIPKQSNVKIFNDTDYIKATRVLFIYKKINYLTYSETELGKLFHKNF